MLASDGAKCPHFPTGGVYLKKSELISSFSLAANYYVKKYED